APAREFSLPRASLLVSCSSRAGRPGRPGQRRTSMANWRQLAMSALLADGTIDEREVEILRKELFADRRIDRAEMEFLLEARRKAGSSAPSFEKLLFEALHSVILAGGVISTDETEWI